MIGRGVALAAVAMLGGCLFPSLGGLTGGDASVDARVDAQADVDASTSEDAGDAAVDAPAFLAHDDFEDGCAPYAVGYGTSSTSNVAHTGSASCQVCCVGGSPYCTLDRGFNGFVESPTVGATYTYGAWMREAPQTTSTQLSGVIVAREYSGGNFVEQGPFMPTPMGSSWTYYTTDLVVMQSGDGLTGYVGVDGYQDGDCFLVDDVTVSLGP
jgi:hypothetical protein